MKELTKDSLLLSVVIPCYNEVNTIETVVDSVRNCGIKNIEIIVVDDASTDGTREKLKEISNKIDRILLKKKNAGKGAALASGFKVATGDVVAIQDADLEYDPSEFVNLIEPFLNNYRKADVVYGSRYARGNKYMVESYYHTMGNKFLTLFSNIFSDLWLTDMETCYKLFRRELIQSITIDEKRFGFEPEITAKIAKKKQNINFYEMPISYYPRNYEQGKKIGIKDGFRAIYCIIKYNLLNG